MNEYQQQLFTLIPKTEVLKQAKPKAPKTYLEELEQHSFSVQYVNNDDLYYTDVWFYYVECFILYLLLLSVCLYTVSFSCSNPTSERGHEADEGWEKTRYISRQFMAELGLSQWRSSGFWLIVFLFCFIFFVRLFLHYVAQWGYLQLLGIPINK